MSESTIAGYILAGVIASIGIGFYIYLCINIKNLQR